MATTKAKGRKRKEATKAQGKIMTARESLARNMQIHKNEVPYDQYVKDFFESAMAMNHENGKIGKPIYDAFLKAFCNLLHAIDLQMSDYEMSKFLNELQKHVLISFAWDDDPEAD